MPEIELNIKKKGPKKGLPENIKLFKFLLLHPKLINTNRIIFFSG
jgi:hypothetical protein